MPLVIIIMFFFVFFVVVVVVVFFNNNISYCQEAMAQQKLFAVLLGVRRNVFKQVFQRI